MINVFALDEWECQMDISDSKVSMDVASKCNIYGITAWKVSKYGVLSGPYFPVFGLNTGKCGPAKSPYASRTIA